jgi:hypothetical protein
MHIRFGDAVFAVILAASSAACARDPQATGPSPSATAAAAAHPTLAPPAVPDALRVAASEALIAKAAAQGSQIYECQSGDAGSAWKLVGPEAVLTDETGARLGKHYAGPTWEAVDGSKVVGAVAQKADAPGGGAVPWLLLSAKSTEGTGKFSHVTSIQRVDTVGGVAPATGCAAGSVGTRQSVPYTATYYFYARSG